MKIKTILFSAFCLFICACNQGSVDTVESNKVMSSQVYQVYDIEANKSETKIVATFRVGGSTGTTLALTEPGKILYNGTPLDKSEPSNLIGTNYRMKGTDYRRATKNYQPKHEFIFTDNDGKTYTNAVSLTPIEISANGGLSLQASQPSTIPLSRTVGSDEYITIGINSIIDDQIPTADGSVYLNPARNAIVVTPKYWQSKQLKAQAEVTVKVKKSVTLSQGSNLGGSISATFAASPVFVAISNAKATAVNANVKTANVTTTANVNTNTTAKVIEANIKSANSASKVNANK